MKKQGKGNREQGTENDGKAIEAASVVEPAAEAKPRARAARKKSAPKVEVSAPQADIEVPPVEIEAAQAKKAPRKATSRKPKTVETPVDAAEPETPIVKKASRKKTRPPQEAEAEPGVMVEASEEIAEPAIPEFKGPEPKLERLQKILAKAGISSRRKAEELIAGGHVQINGQVVTELGTKADPARDHVRVDGKLLQGAERLRYFALNKPKGYVTTVSDPEGRPTVMQFFTGERERLYPVGRLDYLSEGLLLVTNDGELANKLTKASSGVEKTYLVKVAGQPSEAALDALRQGVVIEKGRGIGSGRVRTAPAQIRQVRQGDNPWFEVIVIEGRNRELRKMFEEIGHHVEKIRRIGYGPLILDLEPGKQRELEPEEVHALRLASEGKLKTRRRRGPAPAQLPTVAGKPVRFKSTAGKPEFAPRSGPRPAKDFRPKFGPEREAGPRPDFRKTNNASFQSRSGQGAKPGFAKPAKFAGRPRVERSGSDQILPPRKFGPPQPPSEAAPAQRRPGFDTGSRPAFRPGGKPAFRAGGKPEFRADRPGRPFRAADARNNGPGPRGKAPFDRSRPGAPPRDFRAAKPRYEEPEDTGPSRKTPGFRIEPVEEKPRGTGFSRPPAGSRPFRPRPDQAPAGASKFAERPPRPSNPRREQEGGPRFGPGTGARREFRPGTEFGPGAARPGRNQRPARPSSRFDGPSRPSAKPPFEGPDRPREFRPKPASGAPKKFAGARPAPESRSKAGPTGVPKTKERWRNSFTGKNKGRPKPKPAKG